MTDRELPEPLVPPEVDLTDFQFMPLFIEKLKKSKAWLACKRRPELGYYLINLWTRAWHERPAGSIEADDDVLADAAICDHRKWPKLKSDLLRGWIECKDGRLYNKVVAELARNAWAEKLAHRNRTKGATEAKKRKREEEEARRNDQRHSGDDARNDKRDDSRNDNQGRGKGEGEGEGKGSNTVAASSNTPSGALPPPTRTGAMALLLRNLGNAKGKIVRVASIDKKLIAWAEKGITDEQITEAFELALQDRELKSEAAPITPGFVDVFLGKLLNPGNGGSRVMGTVDWWDSVDGIKAEAARRNIEIEGREALWLRCAIAVDVGGDKWPWIDPRNGTEERFIREIREDQA